MNTIQHYSKSLLISLFLILSIGNVWGWEHTFTKGTTDVGTWVEYTTTPELCKMQYVNGTGTSYTGGMDASYEMSLDTEKGIYYVDVTTDNTTFFFRFSYLNALYAADWNNYPNGTPVIANGNKVNADKDVSNWENKSTCYYQGAKGDQIRIWFDGLIPKCALCCRLE